MGRCLCSYIVLEKMDSDLHKVIRSKTATLTPQHVCYFTYQILRGFKARPLSSTRICSG